jgi:hypothetical protein
MLVHGQRPTFEVIVPRIRAETEGVVKIKRFCLFCSDGHLVRRRAFDPAAADGRHVIVIRLARGEFRVNIVCIGRNGCQQRVGTTIRVARYILFCVIPGLVDCVQSNRTCFLSAVARSPVGGFRDTGGALTVMLMAAEVVAAPELSVATAVSAWDPAGALDQLMP